MLLHDPEARKRLNQKSYDGLRKIKGLSFRPLKRHKGSLRIFYPMSSYPLYRKGLPTADFPRAQLEDLCKLKYVTWFYAMEFLWCPRHRRFYPVMVNQPFIVLDVDRPKEEVEAKLDKWEFGRKTGFSVARSVGGRNCHIHIWLDFSDVPFEPNMSADQEHFRVTDRHRLLEKVKEAAASTLLKDCGIEVDTQALGRDEIAVHPREIADVNAYWAGRTPLSVGDLLNDVKVAIKEKRRTYATGRMAPMADELRRFLEDPNATALVRDYVAGNGVSPGKAEHYETTRKMLLKEFDTIIAHWAETNVMHFLKGKTDDISIEYETVNAKLFGLSTTNCRTYVRHFAMYIWNLKVAEQYVYKKRTNIYAVNETANLQGKIYFVNDFLKANWYSVQSSEEAIPLTKDALSSALGNGQTYNTLEREIPRLVSAFGPHQAKQIVEEAIDDSTANDKGKRKNDSRRYINKLADWWGLDANDTGRVRNVRIEGSTPNRHGSNGPFAGRVPGGGFFDGEPAGREEADEPVFRPLVQHAGRASPDDGVQPPEEG